MNKNLIILAIVIVVVVIAVAMYLSKAKSQTYKLGESTIGVESRDWQKTFTSGSAGEIGKSLAGGGFLNNLLGGKK